MILLQLNPRDRTYRQLFGVFPVMLAWGALGIASYAQTPTPACHVTPTSATPPPTQISLDNSYLENTRFFETMWESIGSRFALKPRTCLVNPTFTPGPNSYRLSPALDTSSVANNNPNDYSAHVVQSVFQDDMWLYNRGHEFGWPVILMFASEHMAVAELTSGVGKTRTSDDNMSEDLRQREAKTVIGHLSQGILTRGGTTYDLFSAIGSVFIGSGGRYNGDSCESFDLGPDPVPGCTPITGDPGPGYDYHQARMTKIQGPESCVQMGKRITADSTPAPGADGNRALLGPVD